jgi:hypothetical protein
LSNFPVADFRKKLQEDKILKLSVILFLNKNNLKISFTREMVAENKKGFKGDHLTP